MASDDALNNEEWKLITNSINAYMISESIYAACELDVFGAIEKLDKPSLENIAKSVGLNDYRCSILLMCLCTSGLIIKTVDTGFYHNHPAARKALCRDNLHSFVPFVRFNHQIQQRGMGYFLDSLKSGRNEGVSFLPGESSSLYDRLAESPGLSKLFHDGMAAYTHFGPKIVHFNEMASCKRLLDIGGGNGSVSRLYLDKHPELKAVVMDIEDVCHIGRQLSDSFSDRLTFIADDIFTSQWPANQDAILFSHLLEIFSADKIASLYQKAYDALPVGGKLFVWTIVANDDETGSLQAAKSSAYFLTMASGEGKAYSKKSHLEVTKFIGFKLETIYDRSEYDHLGLVLIKE